jgi:CubicO group peptidase (beta-lactamase class C family)
MSISRRCATGMLLAAPFVTRAAAAATFPAPGVWPSGSPASVGLNVTKLMEAQAYAQQFGGGAGCVIRNGLLVHSWGSLTQLYLVQSATKSFGSALLGFAVDDGKIDVAAPAQRYLPGIGAVPSSNTSTGWLDNIRVDHLATHLGGFPKSRLPSALVCQPGTKFLYSDGGTNWLAALLTKVYGQDLRTLAQSRLFTPIGVPGTAAVWSPLGTEYQMPPTCRFNGGMQANVDTMARLGYLYLNNGNWDGRQIISSAYVKLSTGAYYPRLPVSYLRNYGLLWWVATVDKVPYYRSSGLYNNHTFVFPSLNMVVVRVGTDGWDQHGGSTNTFLEPIVAAVL